MTKLFVMKLNKLNHFKNRFFVIREIYFENGREGTYLSNAERRQTPQTLESF